MERNQDQVLDCQVESEEFQSMTEEWNWDQVERNRVYHDYQERGVVGVLETSCVEGTHGGNHGDGGMKQGDSGEGSGEGNGEESDVP